jgi:hypothetical protein
MRFTTLEATLFFQLPFSTEADNILSQQETVAALLFHWLNFLAVIRYYCVWLFAKSSFCLLWIAFFVPASPSQSSE